MTRRRSDVQGERNFSKFDADCRLTQDGNAVNDLFFGLGPFLSAQAAATTALKGPFDLATAQRDGERPFQDRGPFGTARTQACGLG